jgi:hypothetical protein
MSTEQRRIKGAFAAPTPTLPILEALNNAFISIRIKHPEIPNVVIVVGTSSATNHGHYFANTWDGKSKAVHELMISGQSLQRGAVDVFGTLLHEAVHVYCDSVGIKDTSRDGRWHNARFRKVGEEFGLVLTNNSTIGWSITSVPDTTQATYRDEIALLRKALRSFRKPEMASMKKARTTIRVGTQSGRKVTVPIVFYEQGGFFDAATGEIFLPLDQLDNEKD